MSSIKENIESFTAQLPEGVQLVAVSKFHPVEELAEAYEAGQKAKVTHRGAWPGNDTIWRMVADGSHKERLITFLGGQGSMNVNSWAADSRRIAFISYELMHKQM